MNTVAGNAEPTPNGAIANPNNMPPMQADCVHLLFNINPRKIRNCPTAMVNTNGVM